MEKAVEVASAGMSKMQIDEYGNKIWRNDAGLLHREGGPAIEYANGDKRWLHNGIRHRIDGAALEYVSGYKEWYFEGKLHRENGPAVEDMSGYREYWYDGEKYIEIKNDQEWERLIRLMVFR